jgi:hypothetical protein
MTETRKTIVMFIAIVFLLVLVTVPAVILSSCQTSLKTISQPSKKPYNLSEIPLEDLDRINCFLEAESRFENLTRYQCEDVRSCVFDPSQYERVPDCYFKRDFLGYELLESSLQPNKELYRLKRSDIANATYLEPIENLILTVEYLSDNIIHVKVRNTLQIFYEIIEYNESN